MAVPAPFHEANSWPTNTLFPALYLYPVDDTWAAKHIALNIPGVHTKIGRQINSKALSGERNGLFDSKVLSRQHAEVWEEDGKIYIKDVKSSNGTFINGERLSSEGHESEPFELKSDDIVEFGVDILGEDNIRIVHRKVAARVLCVFTEHDAQVAARAEQYQHQQLQRVQQHRHHHHHQQQQQQHHSQQQQHSGGAGNNGVHNINREGSQHDFPFAQRRPQAQAQEQSQLPQGLGGMGGMRPPGSKTGLSFDVILGRLQGEVQKSRETGAELELVVGKMGEVWDVFGGDLPATLPPFPAQLPPIRAPADAESASTLAASAPPAATTSGSPAAPVLVPASASAPSSSSETSTSPPSSTSTLSEASESSSEPSTSISTAASTSPDQPTSTSSIAVPSIVLDLQSQLRDTQATLASHLDKIRVLEGAVREQEAMRREVGVLKELVERMSRGVGVGVGERGLRRLDLEDEDERGDGEGQGQGQEEESDNDDNDDARSVMTVIPRELESIEENEEEMVGAESRDMDGEREREVVGEDEGGYEVDFDVRAEGKDEVGIEVEREGEGGIEAEEYMEDPGVSRPRTPEPGILHMGGDGDRMMLASVEAASEREHDYDYPTTNDGKDVDAVRVLSKQIEKLSQQVSSAVALALAMEARHEQAQSTISGLEGKVEVLEGLLRDVAASVAEGSAFGVVPTSAATLGESNAIVVEMDRPTSNAKASRDEDEGVFTHALEKRVELWKNAVESRWSTMQEEWRDERLRLDGAREEWKAMVLLLDLGPEKMADVAAVGDANASGGVGEKADGLKHHGGLVTPPSPRSQSSDSGRGGRLSGSESASEGTGEGGDPEEENEFKGSGAELGLATPDPSVYRFSEDVTPLDGETSSSSSPSVTLKTCVHPLTESTSSDRDVDDDPLAGSSASEGEYQQEKVPNEKDRNSIFLDKQTAFGFVILGVATAAAFWKIIPE